MDTKTKGDITVAKVLAALLEAGKVVLVPFGDNQRYDLATDEGDGRFSRIQCKTGRIEGGFIRFQTSSSYGHRGRGKRGYRGEVESFGVYCPGTNKVYLVPVSDVPSFEGRLRIESPKHLMPNTRWAKDYEFPPVSARLPS